MTDFYRPGEPDQLGELLQLRTSIEGERAKAGRAIRRHAIRRRILPGAVVGSALLVTAGFADRLVQRAVPSSLAAPTSSSTTSLDATARQLAKVAAVLAADQRAIASLAATTAHLSPPAPEAGSASAGSAAPSSALPNLPALPSIPAVQVPPLPSLSAPAASSAPSTHASTGASVVVP